MLAKHVAHLFIRDPVSLFKEMLDQEVEDHSDHFEVVIIVNFMTDLMIWRGKHSNVNKKIFKV